MHYFHTKINNEIDILKQGDRLVVSSMLFLIPSSVLSRPARNQLHQQKCFIASLFCSY